MSMSYPSSLRPAAASELRATLDALGLTPGRAAQLFHVSSKSVRRWRSGNRRIPAGVGLVLCLLAAKAVTIDQVEQATTSASAQTSGAADPRAPAHLLGEPASEPPA